MTEALTQRKPRGLWGKREPLTTWRGEMEDLLSRFWEVEREWFGGEISPSVDVAETDKTLEVRMDIPGVTAKDIDIRLNHNVLTVTGERKEEKEEKGKSFHRVERRSGNFSRTVTLPCAVAEDEVAAEYRDGVLAITLPKTEEAQTRKIKVKE